MASKTLTSKDIQGVVDKLEYEIFQLEKQLKSTKELSEEWKDLKAILHTKGLEIKDLEKDLEALSAAEESAKDSRHWPADKILIEKAIDDNYMGHLVMDSKIIFCRDYGVGQRNAQFESMELSASKPVYLFEKICGCRLRGAQDKLIIALFQEKSRNYFKSVTSFNQEKWKNTDVYNKAKIIMEFWAKPNFAECTSYNKDFDILLHCVGGGKKENIDHLEQWIAYKYLNPEAVANTPNLDIGGNPGGNGKGRYVKLCETIFTTTCVVSAAAKDLENGFNASWEPAVVIHYDEQDQKDLPSNRLKNVTGSETQRIEKKGVDATMSDRNFSIVFTSNNENGVVQLMGVSTGEDRRYSVLITNIVMVDYIMQLENIDTTAAMERVSAISDLIKNTEEVGKWLAHIMIKHDVRNMTVLKPLHGIDYTSRFADQKSILTRAFDAIYPVFLDQSMIPLELLVDLVHVLTDDTRHKSVNVKKKFEDYLTNKRQPHVHIERVRVDYKWNGVSSHQKSNDRPQKTTIQIQQLDPELKLTEFNYDLVSTRALNLLLPLTAVSCKLSIS